MVNVKKQPEIQRLEMSCPKLSASFRTSQPMFRTLIDSFCQNLYVESTSAKDFLLVATDESMNESPDHLGTVAGAQQIFGGVSQGKR